MNGEDVEDVEDVEIVEDVEDVESRRWKSVGVESSRLKVKSVATCPAYSDELIN